MTELNKTQIAGILLATSLISKKYGKALTQYFQDIVRNENLNVLAIVSLLIISSQNIQLSILLGIIYLVGMLHLQSGKIKIIESENETVENFAPFQTVNDNGEIISVSQLPIISEKFIADQKTISQRKKCQSITMGKYFNIDENTLSTNQTHSSYHNWN